MKLAEHLLENIRVRSLYVITDSRAQRGRSHLEVLAQALEGGADLVQLRDKDVSRDDLIAIGKGLKPLCKKWGALLIVNDRLEVAEAIDADGVHIGQGDIPIEVARSLLGKKRVLGVSTHTLDQALTAEAAGADYIGVGPIFQTPTKPDAPPVGIRLISQVKGKIRIPFVAIGGINLSTLDSVLEAGAESVAVVRAVVAQEDIRSAARRLKEKLLEKEKSLE